MCIWRKQNQDRQEIGRLERKKTITTPRNEHPSLSESVR